MPMASRGMINGQRVKLQTLQDTADNQIKVAFASAHMAMSPQVDAFTRAYGAELHRVRNAVPAGERDDEEENDPNATVPLAWLFASGELKKLTEVIQKAVTAAAAASAQAAQAGVDEAAPAGVDAAEHLTRLAQPPGQQRTAQVVVPSGTAAALLAQAQALNPENQDKLGVDETIDGIPAAAVKDTRNAAVTGLVAGLASQAMQQAVMMGVQGALTSALTASRNGIADAFNQTVNLTITQNASILSGWVWTAQGGACIACLEMDGSIHGWDEDLNSHVGCKCMQVPYTGPLPDDFLTGDQWFNQQSDLVQQEILGPSKYLAWTSGDVQLMDFVDHSGGYISERSLKSLGLDARDYLQTLPTAAEKREMLDAFDAAVAERNAIAYAPEFPELPGIPEPGNVMGYTIDDYGGAREALSTLTGREFTDDQIGGLLGARAGDTVAMSANEDGSVKFYLNSATTRDYSATRTLYRDAKTGELVMENEGIAIREGLQGQEIGAHIFGAEVQNLADIGVVRIETGASGNAADLLRDPTSANGFYTWARMGYDTKLADLVDEGLNLQALHEAFPGVETLQDLMVQPGGPAWWRANGVSFRGTFDLKEGSISHQILDSYLQAKGIVLEPLEKAAAKEVSSEVKALQDQRATLAAQRDAAQAKLDTLSEKWRAAVLDQAKFDRVDDAPEWAAAEKKIANIEKQQATQMKKLDTLDAKMAKVDAKISTQMASEVKVASKAVAADILPEFNSTVIPAQSESAWHKVEAAQERIARSIDRIKTEAARTIYSKLQDNPAFAKMAKAFHSKPEAFTSSLLQGWSAGLAGDGGSLFSLLQKAAQEELGADAAFPLSTRQLAALDRGYAKYGDALKAFQRAQYEATQQWYADQGITSVRLYRGMSWAADTPAAQLPAGIDWQTGSGTAPVHLNPMSSFSTNAQVAWHYSTAWNEDGYHLVIGADVPVSRIVADAHTGVGSLSEYEVVVLGKSEDIVPYKAFITGGAEVPQAADITGREILQVTGTINTYTLPEINRQVEDQVIQAAKDALAGDGVASHTDAIDIGQQIDAYVQERLGPLSGYVDDLNSIRLHPQDLTGEQIAWLRGDTSQHGGLTPDQVMQQYQAARRDETVRLLGQVRDMGGTDLTLADGAPAALEDAIRQAQDVLPTQWLGASNDDGAVKLVQDQNRRGYYRADVTGGDGTVALRANDTTTPDDLYTAAVHELGHRIEATVDGVWQLERDFYEARTAGEDFVALPASLRVAGRTKVDQWVNPYLGKDPIQVVRSGGLPTIEHYELLSSGLEWLLGADPNGAYWLSRDPEFRQFIYGILFGTKGG